MGLVNRFTDSIGLTNTEETGSLLDQGVKIISDPGKAAAEIGQKVSDAVHDVGTTVAKSPILSTAAAAVLIANGVDPSVAVGLVSANAGAPPEIVARNMILAGVTAEVANQVSSEVSGMSGGEAASTPPSGIESLPTTPTPAPPPTVDPFYEYIPAPPSGIESLPTAPPPLQPLEPAPPFPDQTVTPVEATLPTSGSVGQDTQLESFPEPPSEPTPPATSSGDIGQDTQLESFPEPVAPSEPGIFDTISEATGLPASGLRSLATLFGLNLAGGLLAPTQTANQLPSQGAIGIGLSPNYQPYRYQPYAQGGIADLPHMAGGGISDLGGYSDGGRLLKGPGDGVSDSIPAVISGKQPARLADGEFVVPARIVSELGNGSTDAGARKLYEMIDRIQSSRRKTLGGKKYAKDTKTDKFLPV